MQEIAASFCTSLINQDTAIQSHEECSAMVADTSTASVRVRLVLHGTKILDSLSQNVLY